MVNMGDKIWRVCDQRIAVRDIGEWYNQLYKSDSCLCYSNGHYSQQLIGKIMYGVHVRWIFPPLVSESHSTFIIVQS